MKKRIILFFSVFVGASIFGNLISAQENEQKETVWPSGELTLQEAYEKTPVGGTLRILRGEHSVSGTLIVRMASSMKGRATASSGTIHMKEPQ